MAGTERSTFWIQYPGLWTEWIVSDNIYFSQKFNCCLTHTRIRWSLAGTECSAFWIHYLGQWREWTVSDNIYISRKFNCCSTHTRRSRTLLFEWDSNYMKIHPCLFKGYEKPSLETYHCWCFLNSWRIQLPYMFFYLLQKRWISWPPSEGYYSP